MEEYIAKKMAEAKVKNKNNSRNTDAERKAKEQLKKKEEEDAERKAKEQLKKKEEEEAERKAKEQLKKKVEEEAEHKAKEQLKKEEEAEHKENEQDKRQGDSVPELVFIVPYRDRRQQRNFFVNQMKVVLEDIPKEKYEIFYIHQIDNRGFNRGAMRNIGYLMLKDRYPHNYRDITIIFNDVDTMPYKKNFLNYKTNHGIVKHFYGFTYALGGIVSITGGDFEKTKGYPNFWAWGYEDNTLEKRVHKHGINIDRSNFYPIGDKNIIQIKDDIIKSVNRTEFNTFIKDNDISGYHTITNLKYSIDHETGFVDVTSFDTEQSYDEKQNIAYDITSGKKPFSSKKRGKRMGI